MTVTEWHEWLARLAIEAGANPELARERMAQAAHVAGSLDAVATGEAPEIRAVTKCRHCGRVGDT